MLELVTLDTATELLDLLLDLLLAIDVVELATDELATDELVPPLISLLIAANKLFAPVALTQSTIFLISMVSLRYNKM